MNRYFPVEPLDKSVGFFDSGTIFFLRQLDFFVQFLARHGLSPNLAADNSILSETMKVVNQFFGALNPFSQTDGFLSTR